MSKHLDFLYKRAEDVLALMMAIMFITFIAQVVFRYLINFPLAWTDEVCNTLWLWGILWGAAFVMRSNEDIRFDMLYNSLSARTKRICTIFASGALVLILLASLPASWSYVNFMKVEKSASLLIPMNWVYSIYVIFILAMASRHARIVWDAWHGRLVEDPILAKAFDDAKHQTTATQGAAK
jgi:TRAP-type C4-dicarboxylate transport system permease small subunit